MNAKKSHYVPTDRSKSHIKVGWKKIGNKRAIGVELKGLKQIKSWDSWEGINKLVIIFSVWNIEQRKTSDFCP